MVVAVIRANAQVAALTAFKRQAIYKSHDDGEHRLGNENDAPA